MHGLVWLEGAPDMATYDQQTIEEKQKALDFFKNLVTAENPNQHEFPSPAHPCSLKLSEIDELQQDLIQLINRVQRHTKYTETCIRTNRKTKLKECRYRFPQQVCDNAAQKKGT